MGCLWQINAALISTLRTRLAGVITREGLTQRQVADETGYSLKTVREFCAGRYCSVSFAQALIDWRPALGEHLVCPHCHAVRLQRIEKHKVQHATDLQEWSTL